MAMAKSMVAATLKALMILSFAWWICLWLLKPTNFWTRKWKKAEDKANSTIFGYYGLDFAVCTFPVIAVAIFGLVNLNLIARERRFKQQPRSSIKGFTNPLLINSLLGILSSIEVLAVFLLILVLVWTFYMRISNDMHNLLPDKSLKLSLWQLKYLRVATRFGLLAEICLALLLLPILRGLALFRAIGIQFEVSVRYHIWLGTAMIFFAAFHGGSTLFIWGVSHYIDNEMWRWQKTGRIYLAGEIALISGLAMWITALPQVRRKKYEIFYCTHHLYIVFLLFFLFHAGDRHFYMVFPGIFLFTIDRLLRMVQSRPATSILSARVFPNKAIELTLSKDPNLKYMPTSVIYMKIPSISKLQWHSFSLTSSSSVSDRTMSVIMKCEGDWTSSLYDVIRAELDSDVDSTNCIPVRVDGPYGPASLDFLRHESLLLIAGGIGITPFLSILNEIASTQNSSRYQFPSRILLVYVVKKCQDIHLLNSVSPLLFGQSRRDLNLKLKVFVTKEDTYDSEATVRELLNDLSITRTINFDTKCLNDLVNPPKSPILVAALVAMSSILFLVFLICLNHIFAPAKKASASKKLVASAGKKMPAKEKTPSSIIDLLLLSSFVIAVASSILLAIILRRKRVTKQTPPVNEKQRHTINPGSTEAMSAVEEHEIHYGGRPNFQDVFSKFASESRGSDVVGVLVCGPETMKESVARLCQIKSQGINMGSQRNKPYFKFHSLNFTL